MKKKQITFKNRETEISKPPKKVYEMIGISGNHPEIKTFKSNVKNSGEKIGTVILNIVKDYNAKFITHKQQNN